MFNRIKSFVLAHKFISFLIAVAIIAGAYFGFTALTAKKSVTSYVTTSAADGTITTSVSGSGQVSASSTISLQFQASGTLTYLPVKNGDNVYSGQLIAQLDITTAEKAVRDAQASLESTQLSLQKLEGASTLTVPQNKQDAINALNQDYQSGYNTVSSVFTDLPAIMTDLQNIVYGTTFNNFQQNIDFYTDTATTYDPTVSQYHDSLVKSYQIALTEYTKNFTDYKNTTRSSDNTTINSI